MKMCAVRGQLSDVCWMCVVEHIENVHIQCEILKKKIDEAECIVEDCMWKVFSTGSIFPFISDFKLHVKAGK